MSKIDELIQQYCPDGVEYKKLSSISDIKRGTRITKKQIQESGKYCVMSGGVKPMGYYNSYNREKDTITISSYGAAGYIGFLGEKFWANDVCLCVFPHSDVSNRYLYHFLKNNQTYFYSKTTNAIPDHIPTKIINSFPIPVPPMEVQQEIVRVLDSFTELETELTLRQKQYEHYRDQLLTFDEDDPNVEWKTLGEVCTFVCSGGTPSRKNHSFYQGDIPWLRTQEIDYKDIYKTELSISDEALEKSSAKWIEPNCVIIAMYGATAAKAAINKIPLTTNQACCNLQVNPSIANYRYVFHWVCKQYQVLKGLGQGSQSNINAATVKNFQIPIPPLSEQQRIVDILDKFDSLVNDISQGIPAEIEARRKQYEYYRDKLLSFKDINA